MLSWIADGVRDDLQSFPRLDCVLQDRHVSFPEEHYHLLLDVAIDSTVDAFYPRTLVDSIDSKSYKGGLVSSCLWNPSSPASPSFTLDLSILL